MKEAKTFEEYILSELQEAKGNVKTGVRLLKMAMTVLDAKNALLEILLSRLKVRTLSDGTRVINMDPVFSSFDKEAFEALEEFLTSDEEEEEE